MSAFHQGLPSKRFRGEILWWCVEDATGHLTVMQGTGQPSSFPTDTENTTWSSSCTTCTPFCSDNSSSMEFTSFTRWNTQDQVRHHHYRSRRVNNRLKKHCPPDWYKFNIWLKQSLSDIYSQRLVYLVCGIFYSSGFVKECPLVGCHQTCIFENEKI